MSEEMVKVLQLPVIEEHLHKVKDEIEKRINNALSLACSEQTVKDVKAVRAQLNKEYEQYENVRKEIKKKISEPYMQFESVYNECVRDLFKSGDKQLKDKIDDVENVIKEEKEMNIRTYLEEYATSIGVEFITLEDTGVKISLSASEKSLKNQCKEFADKVKTDIEMINGLDYSEEILVEYKNSYDVSKSIMTVSNRHKAIEAEQARQVQEAQRREAEAETIQRVDEVLAAPEVKETEIADEQPKKTVYELSFKVRSDDINKLKALKEFLIKGEYEYEQL